MRRHGLLGVAVFSCVMRAGAAELPPQAPLDIVILSDQVNPHGLSDAELTQPGDLSLAIKTPRLEFR